MELFKTSNDFYRKKLVSTLSSYRYIHMLLYVYCVVIGDMGLKVVVVVGVLIGEMGHKVVVVVGVVMGDMGHKVIVVVGVV